MLILYSSNWLYNAGVIGLCRVLEELGEQIENCFTNDGGIRLCFTKSVKEIFDKWQNLSPKSKKGTSLVYGSKNAYYANQTEASIKRRIDFLCKKSNNGGKGNVELVCSFCTNKVKTRKSDATFLNQAFGNILLGSEKTFGNMYWNNTARDYVCSRCEFILMCHHLALTPLSDGSEIFINAPSFQVIWYLNKYAKTIYSKKQAKTLKEILGMSLIELAIKLNLQLGRWTSMSIEVVSKYKKEVESKDKKYKDEISFFSLPYEVAQLLSNKSIANLLDQIGEFKILNMVLDGKFNEILEFSERVFRVALKPKNEWSKHENEFIKENVKLERNKNNLISFSQKLFKLYALIEEEIKKEVKI